MDRRDFLTTDAATALVAGLPVPLFAQNGDPALNAVFDTIFQQKFYSDMNSVWQGEWNLPLSKKTLVTVAAILAAVLVGILVSELFFV